MRGSCRRRTLARVRPRRGRNDRRERHPVRVARHGQHCRVGEDAADLDEAPEHRGREPVSLDQALGDHRVVGRVSERRPRHECHGNDPRHERQKEEESEVAPAARHRGAVYLSIKRRLSDGSTVSAARRSGDSPMGHDRQDRMTDSTEATDPREGAALGRAFDVPWYPMLFAAAWVVNLWIETGVSVLAVTRSLAVVVLGVALILVVASLISRRPSAAGAFTVVIFGLLVSRSTLHALAIVVLAVAVALAVRLWARIRRRPFSWQRLTHALNLFALLTLLVALAGGIGRGTLASVATDLQQGRGSLGPPAGSVSTEGSPPDILVLLLDGYPRADWYAQLFDGDNSAFLGELEERGFDVARDSTSNYMFTQLTLASMFHMRPVPEIAALEPVFDGTDAGHPRLRNTINDNPVFDLLRERGYEITTFGPGYEHAALRQSDIYLDGGQLNDFEYELLRATTLETIVLGIEPGFLASQKRDRVREGFDAFARATAENGEPTFAFVHLAAPHLPVAFQQMGARRHCHRRVTFTGRRTRISFRQPRTADSWNMSTPASWRSSTGRWLSGRKARSRS